MTTEKHDALSGASRLTDRLGVDGITAAADGAYVGVFDRPEYKEMVLKDIATHAKRIAAGRKVAQAKLLRLKTLNFFFKFRLVKHLAVLCLSCYEFFLNVLLKCFDAFDACCNFCSNLFAHKDPTKK